ncbi:hypothetical protein [Allosalinactinospora lopnorensis]|uniref:hypothetical protein n=1 Tax=Allosalinactinospora lopnorensis TaxID=1352348 RepID=UPI0012E1BA81|nr:hypothetical protein [Allosalinactinospora lopnorensis]
MVWTRRPADHTLARNDAIGVLVNNAGAPHRGIVEETTPTQVSAAFDFQRTG